MRRFARANHDADTRTLARLGGLAMALAVACVALCGCGSSKTETVSVSSNQTPNPNQTKQGQAARKAKAPQGTQTSSSTAPTGGTPSRSSTAPAFTQQGGGGEEVQTALATVKAHGYTASDSSEYRSSQTLRVLVGTRTGSSDGHGQQAFFFVNGRYIGTDTSAPSATVKVVSQADTEVTLAYPLYRVHDPLCCPGGGEAKVRFQLNNGRLVPLDPIPPASSASGLSRQ